MDLNEKIKNIVDIIEKLGFQKPDYNNDEKQISYERIIKKDVLDKHRDEKLLFWIYFAGYPRKESITTINICHRINGMHEDFLFDIGISLEDEYELIIKTIKDRFKFELRKIKINELVVKNYHTEEIFPNTKL